MAGTNSNTARKKAAAGKTAGKPAGRKTGGSAKTPTRRKSKTEDSFIRAEVIIICSFAVALLLFLSNLRLCGAVGAFLRSLQLGVFGVTGFLGPVILFIGTCFHLSNKGSLRANLKITAVAAAFLTICGFAQLMFGQPYMAGREIAEYYTASSQSGTGGGLVGGLITAALCSMFGTVGAYLVLIVILIICMVCITEKSFVSLLKRGGGRAYRYARDDVERRMEIHAERQEERRRLREEQRVRGVNLDATNLRRPWLDEEDEEEPDTLDQELARELDDESHGLPASHRDNQEEIPGQTALSASPEPSPRADLFVGDIHMPEQIFNPFEEEEDKAPFDEEADPARLVAEGIGNMDGAEEIFAPRRSDTLEELGVRDNDGEWEELSKEDEAGNEFFIPEGSKRVVTAAGKIIESDTEMLKKKLEERREEAVNREETTVAEQIRKTPPVRKEYIYPPLPLLKRGAKNSSFSDREYRETAVKLQQTLQNFGVSVTVTNISCGPSVTRYELHPEQGVKVSRIVGLTDDIKLSLAATDIRIEAPIPGKSVVGIEVPNKENNVVLLRDLLESEEFQKHRSRLAFAVGKDIGGQTVVTDIAKMPHLLIAGATGSGKSVCINTLIMSVLYKASPDEVKLIMVDPKVVELSVYNGIPHLLIPVVTDPKKASGALNWAVAEMTDRYNKFAQYNVRDLKGYNQRVENLKDLPDEDKPLKLPQIIIIVDELADLMMVAPGEVEDAVCRLAQLARAAGIHLVIATQRPSVNVITGLIKANVPSRIAFSVSSGVDSRTIIDMNGAEKLLGKGDMLFYPSGYQKPQRVQGAFVSDQEVSQVVEFLTKQEMTTEYQPDIESRISTAAAAASEAAAPSDGRDDYFVQAGKFIIEKDKASIGMLQRMFKIGFNRAARIMDQLAEAGVVGEEEGTKPRKVLMTLEEFEEKVKAG